MEFNPLTSKSAADARTGGSAKGLLPADAGLAVTTVAATALLLRGVQGGLVGIGDVSIELHIHVSHNVLDEPALPLGAIAHQLDEIHRLVDGLDGTLQLLIRDADEVDALATGAAGPGDLPVVVLPDSEVRSAGVGGVSAQATQTQSLVAYALLHLDQTAVEFADLLIIAAILEFLGHNWFASLQISFFPPAFHSSTGCRGHGLGRIRERFLVWLFLYHPPMISATVNSSNGSPAPLNYSQIDDIRFKGEVANLATSPKDPLLEAEDTDFHGALLLGGSGGVLYGEVV